VDGLLLGLHEVSEQVHDPQPFVAQVPEGDTLHLVVMVTVGVGQLASQSSSREVHLQHARANKSIYDDPCTGADNSGVK
jgi:hypothetical protein